MKKSRFLEEKIISILKQLEAGGKAIELARKNGVSEATIYNWKARYGGTEVSQLRRLKELEAENARLKRMYADLSLTHQALQDAINQQVIDWKEAQIPLIPLAQAFASDSSPARSVRSARAPRPAAPRWPAL